VSTRTRPEPSRSRRDELEQLQERLQELRRLHEVKPRENAELASKVEQLEQEVRWLRRAVTVAHGEWARPASSLPEQLQPPFSVTASQRTLYGQAHHLAGRMTPLLTGLLVTLLVAGPDRWRFSALPGLFLLLFLRLPRFLKSEVGRSFEMDVDGFGPRGIGMDRVRYDEIQEVEVRQGPLQRLFGFGSVRVTWSPSGATELGRPDGYPERVIDIPLLDDPQRLARWLRERSARARAAREEATRGS
jgi:hypothetical protein